MIGLWIWLCAALAAPLTADEAVFRSLERSVDIAEATAEVEAARGEALATALLGSDPTVNSGWAAVGNTHWISVSQPVSLTGEGLAAHRSALARVESAASTEARTRLEIAAATRLAWAYAVEARQRVDLAEQALALATRLREGAEAREATGDGSLLDARLARLQESEARSTWMVAVADEGQRLAELAAWTGVPMDELDLPVDPLDAMPHLELEATTRSDLKAAREAVDAARARLARERAGTLPSLTLGTFYEEDGDELRVGPSVSVTIPLWSRNADGRARARSELDVAEYRVAERERVVGAEQAATSRVLGVLEGAPDGADPRREAEAALESVAIGFERGELDLLTAGLLRQQILEGQRAWLVGRRVRAEARIGAALAHDAAALIGG
jgi:cobalt-zinc-cadmium efflux system outer membrane protein